MLPTLISLLVLLTGPKTSKVLGTLNVNLASHTMPLSDRYGNSFVNDVFKDNILLTLSYMDGQVKSKANIDWSEVEKPAHYEFTLNPNEVFAFHDKVFPEYSGKVVKTTNAHFNWTDGFKSDGYLTGDGVCHFASLIYWVARDAGLTTYAPTNHNFAEIPDVPKEYGVAIYARPDLGEGAMQNLYITNNKERKVKFVFDYKENNLTVNVVENN